jgi:nitroreductase
MSRIADVRGVPADSLAGFRKMVMGHVEGDKPEDLLNWASRQVYIALGEFVVAAALLGVDTCPMEGFDSAQVNEILGLRDFSVLCACAAGYRKDEDKYAHLAKVRFEKGDVLEAR